MPGSGLGSRNTDATGILAALRLYEQAFSAGELDAHTGPASYDLTDLTRQVLCNLFSDVYLLFASRLPAASVSELTPMAAALSGLIADVDATDAADQNFLLGTWLADAATWGFNASQTANRLFNARNQITLWGPQGEINDYAAKVGWSGLVSAYYGFRWANYSSYLLGCLSSGTTPDWDAWGAAMLTWEQQWGLATNAYPTQPSGASPLAQAGAMLSKYLSNDLSGYVAHAGYDAGDRPAPPAWVQLPGSLNHAAVGKDCPFLAHGDGSSLAACEAACAGTPSCNVINFAPSQPDCVLRHCVNPLSPQLSPAPGYRVYVNGASPGSLVATAWVTDPPALAYLCDLTPACRGFTSQGLLSGNSSVLTPAQGVTYYTKTKAEVHIDARGGDVMPRAGLQPPWAGRKQQSHSRRRRRT